MVKYRTALVLGCGRSGKAAERLLRAEGTDVVVVAEETSGLPELVQLLGAQDFDICIVSPGFSLSHPWVCSVREKGVPLLSELELGWSRHRSKTVAVTGSNGKSTAVKWIGEMIQLSGQRAEIGGNYGVPACEVVLENPDLDWLVLEVSSFQLETVQHFHAEVAVLLNVFPNHLDRHETMEIYRRTKARIFGSFLLAGEMGLVPFELKDQIRKDLGGERSGWITFGASDQADFYYEHGRILHGGDIVADLTGTLFESPTIGGCTGAVGLAVAQACGVPAAVAVAAARAFEPLPHRLQKLGDFQGVTYINDSKATNLVAVGAALRAVEPPIHLIAGGIPKESDFTFLKEILAERVRSIYVIGQASQAMHQAWNGVCPCVECGTLKNAFNTAKNAAKGGETILLSPGCTSFDQFRNFEERGKCFTALFEESVQGGR
jgi:UDP-N-acetylmuramoylalanine--D-glutamate ligase